MTSIILLLVSVSNQLNMAVSSKPKNIDIGGVCGTLGLRGTSVKKHCLGALIWPNLNFIKLPWSINLASQI
jgi:hypothetical protein